ncbi:hypothetical protein NKH77_28540 [Streptomyces sp. M19]
MSAAEVSRQLTVAAYPSDTPRVDPYAAVSSLLTDKQGATPKPDPRTYPGRLPEPRRALFIAGAGGGVVLLVAMAVVVIPRGKARGWRPAGRGEEPATE